MKWSAPFLRVTLLLVLMGLVLAGGLIWREHERSVAIEREIDKLRQEADRIKRENDGLTEKIAYFASPDFQEREAKEKLGFRRLEETVVLVPETEDGSTLDLSLPAAPPSQTFSPSVPPYRKWWQLFFGE